MFCLPSVTSYWTKWCKVLRAKCQGRQNGPGQREAAVVYQLVMRVVLTSPSFYNPFICVFLCVFKPHLCSQWMVCDVHLFRILSSHTWGLICVFLRSCAVKCFPLLVIEAKTRVSCFFFIFINGCDSQKVSTNGHDNRVLIKGAFYGSVEENCTLSRSPAWNTAIISDQMRTTLSRTHSVQGTMLLTGVNHRTIMNDWKNAAFPSWTNFCPH